MSTENENIPTATGVKRNVNKHLENRPTKEELENDNIIQKGNVSNTLAGKAKELELQVNKDRVSLFLKKNPEKVSIYKQKSMSSGVAGNLQGTAKTLEFKITEDRINFLLKNRPTLEELEEKEIIKIVDIQGDGEEKERLRSEISHFLASRPTKESIKEFLQYANVSDSLAPTAKDLEKKMARDKLSQFMKENSKEGMIRKTNSVSDRLAGPAKTLSFKMTQDEVNKAMRVRPSKEELQKQSIMEQDIAAPLAGAAKELKKQMVKDKVQKIVRQNSQKVSTIKKTNSMSNAIAGNAKTMEYKLAEARVNKSLKERPTKEELEERQIIQLEEMEKKADEETAHFEAVEIIEEDDVVDDEENTPKQSNAHMEKFLENRPNKSEMQSKDIISNVANPIAGAAKTLKKQMVKDKVQQIVRQNSQKVSSIKKTNSMSNVIAAPVKTMEFKFAEAHVNFLLKNRPTLQELEEREIIKMEDLEADIEDEEKEALRENINNFLASRPTREEIQEFLYFANVSDSLAATAKNLEKEIAKDRLNKFVKENSKSSMIKKTNSMSDRLAGPAKSLSFKMTQDEVNKAMRVRPSKEELQKQSIIEQDISAPLAGAAKTLKKQMVKDKVQQIVRQNSQKVSTIKKTNSMSNMIAAPVKTMEFKFAEAHVNFLLKNRPTLEELEERDIIKLAPIEGNDEDEKKQLRENISNFLASRPSKEDIQQFLHHATVSTSIENDAEKKLARDKLSAFIEENSKGGMIRKSKSVSDRLAGPAKSLSFKMTQDEVNKSMRVRPSKEELQKQSIIEQDISAPLAGAAKTLKKQMVKDKVQQIVRQNSQKVSTIKKTNSMSNVIAAPVKTMEFKFAEAHVNFLLKNRPTLEELEERDIIKLAPIEGNDEEEKKQLRENISNFLASRPSKEDIQQFLHHATVSSSIDDDAEMKLARDKLSAFIQENSKGAMIRKSKSVSDRLAGPAKSLSFKMTQDEVNKSMRVRPSKEELQKQSIIEQDISAPLAGAAKTLKKQMVKDKVQQIVRQNSQKVSSIKKTNSMSNVIAAPVKTMEFKFAEAHVNYLLKNRPTLKELEEQNIIQIQRLDDVMDPEEKAAMRENIGNFLASRPSRDQIIEFLEYANVSDSIAATAKGLQRKIARDRLNKLMKRQDREWFGASIKKTASMSQQLHGTAKALEFAMKEDMVSRGLKERPTRDEVEARDIIPSEEEVDKILIKDASMKVMNGKKNTLRKMYSQRPEKEDLKKSQIMKDFKGELAPALQGNAVQLETEMNKNKLAALVKGPSQPVDLLDL